MDVKRLPWVAGMMQDLGLDDHGAGFWSDGDRSVYLGLGSAIVYSDDFRTQHRYPTMGPTVEWLFGVLTDHIQELRDAARELDPNLN